ncbi:MAG: rhodanese-like domain-containing protein [Planctomycetes bacterium]|nr:rhodanese-like domain-containing protein [Planctomycetota bacterium]
MRRATWLALFLLLVPVFPCFAAEHTKDSLATVKKKLDDKKAVLVDVREENEWDAGHVRGVIFLPLSKLTSDIDAKELAKVLPKDKVIYTHCASGQRCLSAAEILKKEGYDVRPLKQGFKDLIEAGFPKVDN